MTPETARDLEALQGVWMQTALEMDGVPNPPDDLSPPGVLTTITGTHFVVQAAGGAVLLEGVFVLDADANPRQVDWIDGIGPDAGKRLPAIYRLEGDTFVFVAADSGAPRPRHFCTGPGQIMRHFQRRT